MLAICVCGSSLLVSDALIGNIKAKKILNIAACAIMLIVIVSRFLSGVHWFTDIIGGIIISGFMIQTFSNIVKSIDNTRDKREANI